MGVVEPRALLKVGFPAVLAVVAVGLTLSRWPSQPGSDRSPAGEDEPTSVFRGVELVDRDPDGTVWRISADEGVAREAETTGQLRGVAARFERGGRRVELKAGEAQVDQGEQVRLLGGVEMFWDGYRARVNRATYHRGRGMITSEDAVQLSGPGLSIEGRGVGIDVEGKVARIKADVHAVFQEENR